MFFLPILRCLRFGGVARPNCLITAMWLLDVPEIFGGKCHKLIFGPSWPLAQGIPYFTGLCDRRMPNGIAWCFDQYPDAILRP